MKRPRKLPRAKLVMASGAALVTGDMQLGIPSHRVELPEIGTAQLHYAGMFFAGEVHDPANPGSMRLGITIVKDGCGCGCGQPAIGLFATPDPVAYRQIAQTMIEMADAFEAEAAEAASALLDRVKRR